MVVIRLNFGISMKKMIWLGALSFVLTWAQSWADDIDSLQGKWVVKKTGDRGSYTQQIEFKKSHWIFKILGSDDKVTFAAEGEIELKKEGIFRTARFYKIKAGRSETDLEAVEEERNGVYLLENGIFYLASNFDRARENEKPSVDAYSKAN